MHLTSARDRTTRRPASAGLECLLLLAVTTSCLSAELANPLPAPEARAAPASSTHEALSARLEDAKKALQRDENAAAAAQLEPLLAEIDAAGDRALFLDALLQLAWAQLRQAQYAKSYASYQRLLESSRTAGNRLFEARALFGQASIRKNQGNYADTVRLNREARAMFDALGDRPGLSRTWQMEGMVHDLRGEYRDALQSYERARALIDEKDAAYRRLLNEIGITYKNLGDYERAEKVLQSSLEAHRRNADRYGQATTLGNLGNVSAMLGNNEQAIERYEESLALAREIGERRGQSIALGNLGDVWWQLGETDRASAAFEQQLALGRELGIRYPQARALESLAAIALERGEYERARTQYSQALALEREGGASGSEAGILAALSGVALRQSRTAEARELASRALELARESESPEAEWQAHLAAARVMIADRDLDAALGHLRAGVGIIGSVRGRVLTDTGKVGYLDARQELFHELVAVLTKESRTMEALEAAESARGRAFSDLLAGRALQPGAADRPVLASIRETEARLRAQSRMDVSDPAERAELTQTRAATEAKIDQQLRSLRDEKRELASLVVAEPVSAAEIRATAHRLRATMVEYLVTRDQLFIWVIPTAGEVHATTVPLDRTRLREVVRELHRRFNSLDAATLRDPKPAHALLRQLHDWTLEPIAAHLPRSHDELVYLIPHDVLLMVPFAALEDRTGRAAVSAHTLATAPSIAVLRYTAEKNRAFAARLNEARLLAFSDPTPPPDAAVESLPGARAEVKQISSRFPADHVLALNGADASEANAKRLSADRTILHFAVHGLVRDDRPWDSALILSPGDGEDGWLRVGELFDLKLRADLVMLSGCSTGAGKLSGDGILGLARAFLYAGTPSVIVSQWDVSDLSTAFLMERFYDELLAGRSKVGALRAAQLAAQRRFQHPALWAAFQLIGEPQ